MEQWVGQLADGMPSSESASDAGKCVGVGAGKQQSAGRMRPPNTALPLGLDDLEIPGDLF